MTEARARPQVVVLDDWERSMERLADWAPVRDRADVRIHHGPLAGGALVQAASGADVLVLMRDRTRLDAALLAQLPRLRHVIHTGTRNTALDGAALAARGIAVDTTPWGPSKASTSEHTWALILAAMRRLPRDLALVRAGQWRASSAKLPNLLATPHTGFVAEPVLRTFAAGVVERLLHWLDLPR